MKQTKITCDKCGAEIPLANGINIRVSARDMRQKDIDIDVCEDCAEKTISQIRAILKVN